MATGTAESLAKTMASPAFACLHTKQITVVISSGEMGEGGKYDSNFEQISSISCFTSMTGSERKNSSLKASLSDYLSKQGSNTKYNEIETYVDKWDIENIKSESELSELKMLIEKVKLNGNLLLRDLLGVDDVRALDRVLEQGVQLMVNIAPPAMNDKDLVDEYTKIHNSILAAVEAISAMARSEVQNVSFAKCVSDWHGQVACMKCIKR